MLRKIKMSVLIFFVIILTLVPSNPSPSEYLQVGPKLPEISGEKHKWVPQGLTYLKKEDWLLLSYYWSGEKGRASVIMTVDRQSGDFLKQLQLCNNEKNIFDVCTDHQGHVGGIAVSKESLFVASTEKGKNLLLQYKIDDVVDEETKKLFPTKIYHLNHKASYVSYDGKRLWVGEFNPNTNGTVHRYSFNGDDELKIKSRKQYTTPAKVQGMEFYGDYVFYSCSYGRQGDSSLLVYKGLGIDELVKFVPMYSMSQEIERVEDDIYINFESGAFKYREGGKQQVYNLHLAEIQKLY